MKNKILTITFLIFCLITTFFTNSIALDNSSFKTGEKKIQHKIDTTIDNQLTGKATIIGEVKAAMSCVPSPLEGAKVFAIKIIPFGWLFSKYEAITDINGEYQIEVSTGFYRVFSRKAGYLQSIPFLFHLIRVESGKIYNCSFIVIPTGFPV